MLSTIPAEPTTILAPPPGGKLLCLWLTSDAETLLLCRMLRQLVLLPTCGAQSWAKTARVLFVVWAERDQVGILRGMLQAWSEQSVVEWSSRLVLSGDWSTFGGSPLFASHEYELLAQECAA